MEFKICFVASSGGHLKELMNLQDLADFYESFLVTEGTPFNNHQSFSDRQYYVSKIDRKEKNFFWHFICVFYSTFKIMKIEKPKIVISTGAMIAFPFCLLGKMQGAKVIYIESYARFKSLSLTGKLLYYIVDLFIVQGEELQKKYPKTKYFGGFY